MHTPPGHQTADHATATPATATAPLAALVRDGLLDAELAALLWLLVEVRTPVVVAGPLDAPRAALLDALRPLLPGDAVLLPVTADDEFLRVPEAVELGWRRDSAVRATAAGRASASTAVLLVADLADAAAGGPAGERARIVVRALSLGYGLLATMPGRRLEEVLDRLAEPSIGTDELERSRLGVVLVLDAADGPGDPARVAAAHYVRPVARDQHGHVQHLPPAVLATWNGGTARFDHFAWGVLPELAGLTGHRPIELEREQARRAAAVRSQAIQGVAP